jgi:hypothetical protein
MDRQYQQTNSTTSVIGRGLFGGLVASSSPNSAAVLHVRLRVGAFSEVLWAAHGSTANRLVLSPWKDNAKSVAGLVEKWVKVNQGRLLQARTPASSPAPVTIVQAPTPLPVQAPARPLPVEMLSGRNVSWPLPLQNVTSVMDKTIRADVAEAPAVTIVALSAVPVACQTVAVDRPANWNLMSALSQAQWQRCAETR